MLQLLKEIKIKVVFPEINKEFTIMMGSNLTGLQLKEEFCQLYDAKEYDIVFNYNGTLLEEDKLLIQQGVVEDGTIIIQHAIPIMILISSVNKKYGVKLISKTTTLDLQEHLINTCSYSNVIVTFYKDEEILLPDKSLFDQGIKKNNIITANVKQIGG